LERLGDLVPQSYLDRLDHDLTRIAESCIERVAESGEIPDWMMRYVDEIITFASSRRDVHFPGLLIASRLSEQAKGKSALPTIKPPQIDEESDDARVDAQIGQMLAMLRKVEE
jgi:hypothetical protein